MLTTTKRNTRRMFIPSELMLHDVTTIVVDKLLDASFPFEDFVFSRRVFDLNF